MKYFETLRELENQHIQLECLESLLKMIDPHEHDVNDVDNSLHIVRTMINDTNVTIRDTFQSLWNKIRDDSWREDDDEEDEVIQAFVDHNRFEKIIQPLIAKNE